MSHAPVIIVLLASCAMVETASAPPPPPGEFFEAEQEEVADMPLAGAKAAFDDDLAGAERQRRAEDKKVAANKPAADRAPEPDPEPEPEEGEAANDQQEERTRSWFPEAFLWQPLVETGDDGVATVDVTVPDTLTTWRVLALAHDASGQQAGTVSTFDSRLPVYVDPVVPGWLYAGDRLVLPVQAVNTTDRSLLAALEVRAEGAMAGLGRAQVPLTAGSSDVRTIPLDVVGSGEATVLASLTATGAKDAAERTIPVVPAGRPVEQTRGSTLAGTRTFTLAGPRGADPVTEELHVVVFPGPLAVLQAELERLQSGASPVDGAYGFALTAHLQELASHAAVEVDERALRKIRILAWQRTVRDARAPDPGLAADLAQAVAQVEGHELVEQLRPRLVQTVASGQRADGTWSRVSTSTLQRVLVDTAVAARSLPPDQEGPRLRAMGAVERYAREVKDSYTAAVLLAAGLARGPQQEHLAGLVEDGLVKDATGAADVAVPAGVLNAWGVRPSRAEVLAYTVLALPDDHEARGDLVSRLMGGWDARYGFGAGRADAVALEAIARALPGTPQEVDLVLEVDGQRVASARLDPAQPKVPATLQARPGGEITLRATPEVPGLAFVATRRSWVPWSASDRLPGVDVEVEASGLRVGAPGLLTITAAAPSKTSLVLEQGLPAGAVVGDDAVRLAQAAGATLEVTTDRVRITTRPFQAGEVLELKLPVTPAFAGRFQTVPLTVAAGGEPVALPPMTWNVAGVDPAG